MRKPFDRAGDKPPDWYRVGPVMNLAPEEGADPVVSKASADVYVYNTIGGWFGLTANDFVRDVASLDVDQIVLHLNTPGGEAMEGVAIANVLRAHRARVVVRVDGIAASAGSVIAMAGDEVVMGIGSELMVHDAWGFAVGNAAELTTYVRQLESTSDAIASTYASRTGGKTADWREVMRTEAWYTAEEAVTAGLADRVATKDEVGTAEGEQITPGRGSGGFWDMWDSLSKPDRFDLAAFNYAGRAHAPAPAFPDHTTHKEGGTVAFTDDQLTTLRTTLGLPEDADEEAIIAAVAEQADDAPSPEGVVTIDSAQLDELKTAASLGRAAHARQQNEDRESAVSAAVADGRIPPARREHWLTQLATDPGSLATLENLEKGLIPVGAPIGHGGADEGIDPLYVSLFGKDA